MRKLPVFFDSRQLSHKPLYEWAMGEKLPHPETTHRAETILAALERDAGRFEVLEPGETPMPWIRKVHDSALLKLYEKAREIPPGESFYPSVFPKRAETRTLVGELKQAGYYCLDSGTPLTSTTWSAACLSAACAFNAATLIESGKERAAYALCRPPGHHATRDLFGGYCYFNNAAIIAKRFKEKGRVAILDIDFHHGNGTQQIFYRDDSVFFVSIHGDPKDFYPYFSGRADEIGEGRGKEFNLNIPLPRGCDGQEYLRQIRNRVLPAIRAFHPQLLILSAGFDTYREDPIGAFTLETGDFAELGETLSGLGLPTVILQEGGYCVEKLGVNVSAFLRAFC